MVDVNTASADNVKQHYMINFVYVVITEIGMLFLFHYLRYSDATV